MSALSQLCDAGETGPVRHFERNDGSPAAFQTECIFILAKVAQRAVNKPTNVSLHLVDIPLVVWQNHPAELDGPANLLVNLVRTKELTEPRPLVWVLWVKILEYH